MQTTALPLRKEPFPNVRSLIRVILPLFAVFTAVMVVIRLTGLLTLDDIRYWLGVAQGLSQVYVVAVVVLLW